MGLKILFQESVHDDEMGSKECVDLVITDIAVMEVTSGGLLMTELAHDWTTEEVQALTEPVLNIAPVLKVIEL